MIQETAIVVKTIELMPSTYLTWLETPSISDEALPGHFLMIRCGEDASLRRPLSIHNRDKGRIALLYAVTGRGTQWISQRKSGDKIDLLGPLGNYFNINSSTKNILLVAGGIGVAPLCFLAYDLIKKGISVRLLAGASTSSQLYPSKRLPCNISYATDDGSLGKRGMATDLIPEHISWADQIMACGPMPMYRSMFANIAMFQGKPVQISLEVRMGCGFGVCFGCTIKTSQGLKQVCKDGPVFDLLDIRWDELGI